MILCKKTFKKEKDINEISEFLRNVKVLKYLKKLYIDEISKRTKSKKFWDGEEVKINKDII